ncbi:metal ABC transporter permease [Desulfovibrio sp. TomC]|uniref:metal ABC transporter permease n=1 Tax=Desulfovibrio sp. TomC TaxID=1562888 RepID=UPI0005735ABA|nr:metal ABC transporter permease [Desulfovibrio sp. TomC]KHK02715.1 Zinc ABC transporter, inner membrane permease protein ZnuB [Desulfovibrio sp. TomC]
MIEDLALPFMQNALLAALLAAVCCGIVGTLVVANRMVFLAGGAAHAAYGGVGLAYFLALPVLPVTVVFTVAAALAMAAITLRHIEDTDTVIGVLWAAGMAFGIILLDLTPGYKPDLMSYLFGSIISVPTADLYALAGLDVVLLGTTLRHYNGFVAMAFDREFAAVRGVPVGFLHCLLTALAAVAVVLLIRVAGLILIIALLSVAPSLAVRRSASLGRAMVWASLLNTVFCLSGLLLAYQFNLTSGAAIIAVAATVFFVSLAPGLARRRQGA